MTGGPPEDPRPRFLRELRPLPTPRAPITNGIRPPGTAPAYAAAAFQAELDRLAAQTEPGRNDQLNIAAFNLFQLVASGHLNYDDTHAALYDTALAIGLTSRESAATIASAQRAGLAQPRDVPELQATEIPDVSTISPNEVAPDELARIIEERHPILHWPTEFADERELIEWIVYPIIPARRIVALFSPPKLGKSLLVLEIAEAISRGASVLDHKPEKPLRVLYLDFENDPHGDVIPRLKAMGVTPEQLGQLHYESFPSYAPLDTAQGGQELLLTAQHRGDDLVVIDTISRAVRGEENDNDTWLNFYRHTGQPLKAAGITTLRLDHTGKDLTKGMRGGSAKYGDVDVAWSMMPTGSPDSFQLECVANRLPVPDRLMLIRRDHRPLVHQLQVGDVSATKVADCVAALEEIDFPIGKGNSWGRDKALLELDAHGFHGFPKETVRLAVKQRKEGPSTVTPDPGFLPYKDSE